MSIPLWLKERLGHRVRYVEGSLARFGSPARYHLRADSSFVKTVSAAIALGKRHVPMPEAKAAVERLVDGQEVTIDVPMVDDAALFEGELNALGVKAVKEASSAAAEG
jgi:hypothetical protein